MTVNITVPDMASAGKKVNTKDLIIGALIEEWPLTAKQLFNRVSENLNNGVTYLAVHKTIKQLFEADIIERDGVKYKLSKNWVDNVKKFGDALGTIYSTHGKIPFNYSFEKPLFLTFTNFSDVGRFVIHEFHGSVSYPITKETLCFWTHHWPVIGFSNKEYEFVSKLFASGKSYSATRGKTALDRLFDGIFSKLGKKTKIGVNFSAQQDTFVHDDLVLQVFFPSELIEELDKIYSSIKTINIETLNNLFSELLSKETKINIIIFKSPELADILRSEMLTIFFRSKKK